MAQIVRRTTTDIVADELRNRILNGQLKEGEQVRQEAIASELGVSRIPVREALRQLEGEGLITLILNKGAEVSRLEPTEIEELFQIRTMLEVWVFEHAIETISEDELAEAEHYLAIMRDEAPVEEWGPLNWHFHSALYRAANKPVTMTILKRVHDNIDRYARMPVALSTNGQERAHRQHQEILDAARSKDVKLAAILLSEHINHVKQRLLETVRARKDRDFAAKQNNKS